MANSDDFTSLCRFSGAYFSLPLSLPWADAPTCWWFLVILAIQGWVLGCVLAHSWACLVGPGPLDSVRPLLGGERRCVCVWGGIYYYFLFMVIYAYDGVCCVFSAVLLFFQQVLKQILSVFFSLSLSFCLSFSFLPPSCPL